MQWILEEEGCLPGTYADRGNRFLIGNGYMGVRGTLDEETKENFAAVNLAGIYDQAGEGWREPLNAPNPFYACLETQDGTLLHAEQALLHRHRLDFRAGIFQRHTVWSCGNGRLTLESERFVSKAQAHLSGASLRVRADCAPVQATLVIGIDGDVWDLHGPHYTVVEGHYDKHVLSLHAGTAAGASVTVSRKVTAPSGCAVAACGDEHRIAFRFAVSLLPGEELRFTTVNAVYTTKDVADPKLAAARALRTLPEGGYDTLLSESRASWERLWEDSAVVIDGDDEAMRALNYSLYHLNCIAPPPHSRRSIPARGLSGQTYKGAVFWDTEMFMLDYFLLTKPEVAKELLRYRIDALPGALDKAAQYGYKGAFYAWESQEEGRDACSDYNVTDVFTKRPMRTYFRDKQVHISAAVAYAMMRYVRVTGDADLLAEGGFSVMAECSRFYLSLLVMPLATGRYEIWDVVGPDEYHERVNNNAYTNRMALETLRLTEEAFRHLESCAPEVRTAILEKTGWDSLAPRIREAAKKLFVPSSNADGVIEQFDGYFSLRDTRPEELRSRLLDPREYWGGAYGVASDTQVIKQADVVTMLELFHREYEEEILRTNWEYYEPRTEHGSSLSACMYALLACRFGEAGRAYPHFMKSAAADLHGGGKQWAGLVYIGGTHPAAAGGAWKVFAEGFCGLDCSGDEPVLRPCLPPDWKSAAFRFKHRGKRYATVITQQGASLHLET